MRSFIYAIPLLGLLLAIPISNGELNFKNREDAIYEELVAEMGEKHSRFREQSMQRELQIMKDQGQSKNIICFFIQITMSFYSNLKY